MIGEDRAEGVNVILGIIAWNHATCQVPIESSRSTMAAVESISPLIGASLSIKLLHSTTPLLVDFRF